MPWFRIVFLFAVLTGAAAHADGPLPRLADPVVIPTAIPGNARATGSGGAPLSAMGGALNTGTAGGMVAVQTTSVQTGGHTARTGFGPRTLAGYPVNIAWDHVAVGGGILAVMFLLGESESAAGSF